MPVIGEKPGPRALFQGFKAEEIEAFREFFPTRRAVEDLSEVGGLVLGTVDLFRLVMDVRRRKMEAQEARRLLMEQTGYFMPATGQLQEPKAD